MKSKEMWAIVNCCGNMVMDVDVDRRPLIYATNKTADSNLERGEKVIPVIISERPRKKTAK